MMGFEVSLATVFTSSINPIELPLLNRLVNVTLLFVEGPHTDAFSGV